MSSCPLSKKPKKHWWCFLLTVDSLYVPFWNKSELVFRGLPNERLWDENCHLTNVYSIIQIQVKSSKNDRLLVIKVYRVLAILLSSTIKRIETMQFPKVTWCGVVFYKNEELKNQRRLLAMIFKHNTCIKERTLKRNTLCKTRIRKPISIKKK